MRHEFPEALPGVERVMTQIPEMSIVTFPSYTQTDVQVAQRSHRHSGRSGASRSGGSDAAYCAGA
jgi:phage head maturation protease